MISMDMQELIPTLVVALADSVASAVEAEALATQALASKTFSSHSSVVEVGKLIQMLQDKVLTCNIQSIWILRKLFSA